MKSYKLYFILCTISCLCLSSCEGDFGTTDFTEESTFVEAYMDAESIIINTLILIDEIYRDSIFISNDTTILYDEIKAVSSTNGITIYYGLQGGGSTFPDGILRSGHINVSVSNGNYEDAGSVGTVDFNNFSYKTNACVGSVEFENIGALSTGYEFKYATNGFEINSNSLVLDRSLLFVSDFLPLAKNSRQITITSNDTTRFTHNEKGVSADIIMVSPLEYEDVCEYGITSGELEVYVDSPLSETSILTVDFLGENDCANLIRGYSFEKGEFFFIAKRGF